MNKPTWTLITHCRSTPPSLFLFTHRSSVRNKSINHAHLPAGVWIGTTAETLRYIFPQLQPVVGEGRRQVLSIRVAHHELHSFQVTRDHVAHCTEKNDGEEVIEVVAEAPQRVVSHKSNGHG